MMDTPSKKPTLSKCRLTNARRFDRLFELLKYQGTHLMWERREYFRELAVQTAAKGYNSASLKDNQEIFMDKINELRWVNGFNDCQNSDFERIQTEWHDIVIMLVEDFDADDMYVYNPSTEVLEINVSKISNDFIDLERIIYHKA